EGGGGRGAGLRALVRQRRPHQRPRPGRRLAASAGSRAMNRAMNMKMKRSTMLLAGLGLVALASAPAAAATDCATLSNPIWVTGSTAAKPLLAEIGKLMATQSPPVTVVYLGQGSCTGVDAILSGTPMMG